MIDINKHRFYLVQILKDIYTDIELAGALGFKGGTALMFFHELSRFSLDLDFNLTDPGKEDPVYRKIRRILLSYGKIYDEAQKFHGPMIVLDYGFSERKLKVEISNRQFGDRYEIKNFLGINMKVMVIQDMFSHKLCALLDRHQTANRDIFDCWFFMQKKTPVNIPVIEARMQMSYTAYMQQCIEMLEGKSEKGLMQGMGEILDRKMKSFVSRDLRIETIRLLKFYKEYPIV